MSAEDVISALTEQIGDVRAELDMLKANLMDKRWDAIATNFEQISRNLVHLDTRITAIENERSERTGPTV
jgi:hypothetical protein